MLITCTKRIHIHFNILSVEKEIQYSFNKFFASNFSRSFWYLVVLWFCSGIRWRRYQIWKSKEKCIRKMASVTRAINMSIFSNVIDIFFLSHQFDWVLTDFKILDLQISLINNRKTYTSSGVNYYSCYCGHTWTSPWNWYCPLSTSISSWTFLRLFNIHRT